MNSAVLALIVTIMMPLMVILWNRQRVKGKVLCYFIRKDKSVVGKLCELRSSFIIWRDRAYDVYPDYVRIVKFPMGWPAFLQELVPAALYDEDDAVPKNWITLEAPKEGSLSLRAALEENWVKKLVHETTAEGAGFSINWRKAIPIALIAIGVIGLIVILVMKG